MRALTLWQPWATLVAYEVKPFEFRRWKAPASIWGERIAIHAGARRVKSIEIDALIYEMRQDTAWATALQPEALKLLLAMQERPESIPLSSVLCTAVIGEPVPAAEAVRRAYGASFRGDSDRIDHQVFGWPLSEIRRFDVPVPAKGAQGFWTWPGESVT